MPKFVKTQRKIESDNSKKPEAPMLSPEVNLVCSFCGGNFYVKDVADIMGKFSKAPVILVCGHTVCLLCIRRNDQSKRAIKCHTCQHITELGESGIKSLPINYYMLGVILASSKSRKEPKYGIRLVPTKEVKSLRDSAEKCPDFGPCVECSASPAIVNCVKCEAIFCFACFDKVHSSSNHLRKHVAEPLTASPNPPLLTCELHNHVKDFYCKDDDMVICPHCALVGDHVGHSVMSIAKKNKSCVDDVRQALLDLEKMLCSLEFCQKKLKGCISDKETKGKVAIAKMKLHFQELHSNLQLREMSLLDELQSAMQQRNSDVQTTLQDIDQRYDELQKIKLSGENLLKDPSKFVDMNFFSNLLRVKDTICYYDMRTEVDKEENTGDLQLDPSDLELVKKVGCFTVSQYSSPVVPYLFKDITKSMWKKIKRGQASTFHAELDPNQKSLCVSTKPSSVKKAAEKKERKLNDSHLGTDLLSDLRTKHRDWSSLSQEVVKLSHINSPCDFFIQRQSDLKVLFQLESALKRLNQNEDGLNGMDSRPPLRKNELCLARYPPNDKTWYRARILRVIVPEAEPLLGDSSSSQSVTDGEISSDSDVILPLVDKVADEARLYVTNGQPVAEVCDLAETDTNNHIAEVSSFAETVVTMDIEQLSGKSFTPADSVGQKPNIDAISNIESVLKDEAKLTRPTDDLECDDGVMVEVFYIDYGNTEIVPTSSLRTISPDFFNLSEIAIRCKLFLIEPFDKDDGWSVEAVTHFSLFAGTKYILMTVYAHEEDVLHVDLGAVTQSDQDGPTPVSTRDAMVFMNFARFALECPKMDDTPDVPPVINNLRKYFPPTLPRVAHRIHVTISHMNDWHSFFVQELAHSNNKYLVQLMRELQECYSNPSENLNVYGAITDMPCAVLYNDNRWYRARVVSILPDQKFEVFYVDYGDRETVSLNRVRRLFDRFLKWPQMCFHCCLADLKPRNPDVGWSKEASTYLSGEVGIKNINLEVNEFSDDIANVTLYYEDSNKEICLNTMLVNVKHALSTGPCSQIRPRILPRSISPECTMTNESETPLEDSTDHVKFQAVVSVSNIYSPSCFYAQIAKKQKSLASFMTNLQQCYGHSEGSDQTWKKDDVCVALNLKDNCWYRATVVEIKDGKAELLANDYGETFFVPATDLRLVIPSLQGTGYFAFACSLDGITPSGGTQHWPSIATEFFSALVEKHEFFFLIKKLSTDNSKMSVDLCYEESTVSSALEPAITQRISVSNLLVEKGLALPIARKQVKGLSCSTTTCDDHLSCIIKSPAKKVEVTKLTSEIFMTKHLQQHCWLGHEPLSIRGQKFEGLPTYVNYEGLICLHSLEKAASTLQLITTTLTEKFEGSEPHSNDLYWFKGQPCIAQFELDNCWYRATVTEVKDTKIKVLFIDYGNEEEILPDKLRKDIILTNIPQQGIYCSLYNIVPTSDSSKWPVKVLTLMHKTIVDKPCTVTVMVPEGCGVPAEVKIDIGHGNLEDTLVQLGYAQSIDTDTGEHSDDNSVITVLEYPTYFQVPAEAKIDTDHGNLEDKLIQLGYPEQVDVNIGELSEDNITVPESLTSFQVPAKAKIDTGHGNLEDTLIQLGYPEPVDVNTGEHSEDDNITRQ